MNKQRFLDELNLRNIPCDELQADQLEKFMRHILSWNEKFNLTAIKMKNHFGKR